MSSCKFDTECNTFSHFFTCVRLSWHRLYASVFLKVRLTSQHGAAFGKLFRKLFVKDNILLKVNVKNYKRRSQVSLLLCHLWRKSPDSINKLCNFKSYCGRRNFEIPRDTEIQQILNHACLHINSALNAEH